MEFKSCKILFILLFTISIKDCVGGQDYSVEFAEQVGTDEVPTGYDAEEHSLIAEDALGPSSVVMCSKSEIYQEKTSLRFVWVIKGLMKSLDFYETFPFTLHLQRKNITFNSSKFDGKWDFEVYKEHQRHMKLIASYKYIAEKERSLTFDMKGVIQLNSGRNNFDLFKQRSYKAQNVQIINEEPTELSEFSQIVDWGWGDLEPFLKGALTQEEHDVVFVNFVINVYNLSEPKSHDLSNCRKGQLNIKSELDGRPPFLEALSEYDFNGGGLNFSDLLIKTAPRKGAAGKEFRAHKIIVGNSSPILSEMISNCTNGTIMLELDNEEQFNGGSSSENTSSLASNNTAVVFEELIRYMYTGKVERIQEVAKELITLSNKYGFQFLKNMCEVLLLDKLSFENAVSLYSLGNKVNSTLLSTKAFTIMRENKWKIVSQSEEFKKMSVKYPQLMFQLFLT